MNIKLFFPTVFIHFLPFINTSGINITIIQYSIMSIILMVVR